MNRSEKSVALIAVESTGKPKFVTILEFSSRDVASAFSSAVIAAVLRHSPNAFGEPVEADPGF